MQCGTRADREQAHTGWNNSIWAGTTATQPAPRSGACFAGVPPIPLLNGRTGRSAPPRALQARRRGREQSRRCLKLSGGLGPFSGIWHHAGGASRRSKPDRKVDATATPPSGQVMTAGRCRVNKPCSWVFGRRRGMLPWRLARSSAELTGKPRSGGGGLSAYAITASAGLSVMLSAKDSRSAGTDRRAKVLTSRSSIVALAAAWGISSDEFLTARAAADRIRAPEDLPALPAGTAYYARGLLLTQHSASPQAGRSATSLAHLGHFVSHIEYRPATSVLDATPAAFSWSAASFADQPRHQLLLFE